MFCFRIQTTIFGSITILLLQLKVSNSSFIQLNNAGGTTVLVKRKKAPAAATTYHENIEFSTLSTFPYTVSVVSNRDSWPQKAAQYLKEKGVCVLLTTPPNNDEKENSNTTNTPDLLTNVNNAASSRLLELQRRIENRGVDPDGKEDGPFRFTEVVCRDEGGRRFDMRVSWKDKDDLGTPLTDIESKAVNAFHHHIEAMVQPVLDMLWNYDDIEDNDYCGDDKSSYYNNAVASGFLINKPGSHHQSWHRDGPSPGMLNVFCPLVDLKAELGPTEVWPSSHTGTKTTSSSSAEDSSSCDKMIAPLLKKGQLLLMDYRTLHRGLGNTSKDDTRTVAYVVFQKGSASCRGDIRNFPDALTLEYD